MRRWWTVSIAVLGCTGCGRADDAVRVRMLDNQYAPEVIEVQAGETLEFVNDGRVDHNVIDADGAFDSREPDGDQESGESWSYAFTEPGTYNIYCSLHAVQNQDGDWEGMVATVSVIEGTTGG